MKKTQNIRDAAAFLVDELSELDKKCHWVCSLRLRATAGTTACQHDKSMTLGFKKEAYDYLVDIQ